MKKTGAKFIVVLIGLVIVLIVVAVVISYVITLRIMEKKEF